MGSLLHETVRELTLEREREHYNNKSSSNMPLNTFSKFQTSMQTLAKLREQLLCALASLCLVAPRLRLEISIESRDFALAPSLAAFPVAVLPDMFQPHPLLKYGLQSKRPLKNNTY